MYTHSHQLIASYKEVYCLFCVVGMFEWTEFALFARFWVYPITAAFDKLKTKCTRWRMDVWLSAQLIASVPASESALLSRNLK